MKFTNPRTYALIEDWPIGHQARGKAEFWIEAAKGKERCCRRTTNKKGNWCNPKKLTYSIKQVIVDGDDGKTYILRLTSFGNITGMQSNMQYSIPDFYVKAGDTQFEELKDLFESRVEVILGKR